MIITLPRFLLVFPGLLAGLLLPAVGAPPKAPPASAVGMVNDMFARPAVTVHRGERLTMVNNSGVVHVIGPGQGGNVIHSAPGVPAHGFHLMQTNAVYTTGSWDAPDTYFLTCSVHPGMTLKVVVTR